MRLCTSMGILLGCVIFISCVSTRYIENDGVFTVPTEATATERTKENIEVIEDLPLPTVYLNDSNEEVQALGMFTGNLMQRQGIIVADIPHLMPADLSLSQEARVPADSFVPEEQIEGVSVVLDMPPILLPEFVQIDHDELDFHINLPLLYSFKHKTNISEKEKTSSVSKTRESLPSKNVDRENKEAMTAVIDTTNTVTSTPSYDEFIATPAIAATSADNSTDESSVTSQEVSNGEAEIEGFSDKEIVITLPDVGWIYRSSDTDRRNVELLRVDFSKSGTDFIFRFNDVGKYLLNFERQDIINTSNEERHITVKVLPKDSEDNVALLNTDKNIPSTMGAANTTGTLVDQNTKATLEELLARVQSNVPEIAPSILMSISDIVYSGRAATKNTDKIVNLLDQIVSSKASSDAMLFMLAQMYEQDPVRRGAGVAYKLYGELVNTYPLSRYYTDAIGRMEYISRHFIFIK